MSIRLFDKSIQHNPEISYGDRTTGNALIHGGVSKLLNWNGGGGFDFYRIIDSD